MDEESSDQKYVGFGKRFLAYWVDALILFSLGFVLQTLIGQSPLAIFETKTIAELQALQTSSAQSKNIIFSLGFAIFYFVIFWVNYDGATPGKKLLGIKIVKDDGAKLTYPVAIIRYLGFMLSSVTMLFFGIGFIWMLWDKKKQALHDKLAGTIVIKERQAKIVPALLLSLLSMVVFVAYIAAVMYHGYKIGYQEAKNNKGLLTESVIREELLENQEKDKDKILSFVPSSCGLTIAVPKTTGTSNDGVEQKWLFEEVELSPNNFYVLDSDVYSTEYVQGAFIGYKDADSRLGGVNFSVAYPGLNIFCAPNTNEYTLEEYTSLALANKEYKIETQQRTYWGEVELIPVILEGIGPSGKEIRDTAYIGVTKGENSQLLYIRVWGVNPEENQKEAIQEDLDIIVRNLQYRNSEGASNNNDPLDAVNSNVKGVNTSIERVINQ